MTTTDEHASPAPRTHRLTQLQSLESEAIHIIR